MNNSIPTWAKVASQEIRYFLRTGADVVNNPEHELFISRILASYVPDCDSLDEQANRLLKALDNARAELNAGRCIEAGITLTMALQEHKARLAQFHTSPEATLWEEHESE